MSTHVSRTAFLAVGLLSAAALACNGARSPSSDVSISQAHSPTVKQCALGVADTRIVGVEDTPDGADVVFTTSSKHLDELRTRVTDQAAIHGPDAHKGSGHAGVHGSSQAHGLRLWDMPAREARAVDVAGGVVLHVVATDSEQVGALRARLRERVAKLEARGCP